MTVVSVDDAADTVTVDYVNTDEGIDFVTEGGIDFQVFLGIVDTVASGTFTLTADVTQ